MSIEINGKVYRNLQEQVEKNMEDIEELQEQEPGETYTAGSGIDITENVISVDNTVALKSELFSGDYDDLTDKPDLTVYATKTELNGYIKDNDLNYASTFRGKGVYVKEEGTYTATSYGDGAIARSIPNQPGYTYTLPSATGTLALTSDIPSTTNFVTLDGTQTITGSKTFTNWTTVQYDNKTLSLTSEGIGAQEGPLGNSSKAFWMQVSNNVGDAIFSWYNQSTNTNTTYRLPHTDDSGSTTNYTLATVEDIPTLSGLIMRNYKVVINSQYQYNFSVPYEFDTDLTRYEAIRKIPVNSNIVDITNHKTGIFTWQTSTIAVIYWPDNTTTAIDFTSGFDCVISANAPATM